MDVVPAYSSLAIYFDVSDFANSGSTAFEAVSAWVRSLLATAQQTEASPGHTKQIPVCYAGSFAPDLEALAREKKLSIDEVIGLHTAASYRVYMIGFLPGFAYMGRVDERIAMARKENPRQGVAAGSVGIAGIQTGIYPLLSPGGWQIIGRTPLNMFNRNSDQPVLLQPGDTVSFYSITEHEFADYQGRIA
jgi:inhibitor of KinA